MPDGMILPGLRISGGGPRELLPNDPINRGLIAFWPLDQAGGTVVRDIAPRRRHGTLFNATSPWEAAPHGRALRFDGVNDYVNLGGRWLAGLSSGTFACRFKPNAGGGVLYYEDGAGFNNFALDCPSPGTSALAFYIGSNTLRNSTSRTWVAGQWYDLAITWGDAIRVYINGALDTTISAVVATSTNPGDNDQLARYSFGGGTAGAYTPASMSHVRPYSRALLAAEVARLRLDPWAGTTSPAERLFHAVRLASAAPIEVEARGLILGPHTLGRPAVQQTHHVEAVGLTLGGHVLGRPAVQQNHAVIARGLILGAHTLGRPAVNPVAVAAPAERTVTWPYAVRAARWIGETRTVTWPDRGRTLTWRP